MCFGTALDGAIWNDTGIGISPGMLVGLVIGSMIHKGGLGTFLMPLCAIGILWKGKELFE